MEKARQRFSPGSVDYDGPIAANYRSGRSLSLQATEAWHAALEPFMPRMHYFTILDLGAGAGRFSALLASFSGAHVISLEPSRAMLAATSEQRPDHVAYVAGTAERLPLRDHSCDVVWLSHVLHHVRDREACARELRRVVRAGGVILVRGTFADRLDGFPMLFRFFPGAHKICEDLPTVGETVVTLQREQLALETHRRVRQQTCGSLRAFAERTRLRADTALALLSDEEFSAGQAALELAAEAHSDSSPVSETLELLVFRAPG